VKTKADRYERFAWQFDAAYGDVSRDADREFYCDFAKEAGSPVLELACGAGRVLAPILAAGIDVYGIDAAPAMLECARNRLARAQRFSNACASYTIVLQDQVSLRMPRKFPLVIMPWNVYLNLVREKDRMRCLGRMYEHLLPGGTLVMDVDLYGTGVEIPPGEVWSPWAESPMGTRVRLKKDILSGNGGEWVEEKCTFEIFADGRSRIEETGTRLAALTFERVLAEVAMSGFEITRMGSDFTCTACEDGTTRLVLMAKRPARE
jgi:SAM-dependent methyltransferase